MPQTGLLLQHPCMGHSLHAGRNRADATPLRFVASASDFHACGNRRGTSHHRLPVRWLTA